MKTQSRRLGKWITQKCTISQRTGLAGSSHCVFLCCCFCFFFFSFYLLYLSSFFGWFFTWVLERVGNKSSCKGKMFIWAKKIHKQQTADVVCMCVCVFSLLRASRLCVATGFWFGPAQARLGLELTSGSRIWLRASL